MENADIKEFLAQKVGADEATIQRLLDGGFDDMESLRLIEIDTLQLLGFENHKELFQKIKAGLGDGDDDDLATGLLGQDAGEIQNLQAQMEELKMQHKTDGSKGVAAKPEAAQEEQPLKLEGKAPSIAMVVGHKDSKKTKSEILAQIRKMTHLRLDNKKLELVDNVDECASLTHVYLQENNIYTLLNNPFKGLKNITQLNLYDNQIQVMEGFLDLVNLKKLYLEKNMISKLDGLDNCRRLEEIYLGNQDIPKNVEFIFDEYSLAAISSSLKMLDIPNCNIINPKPLYYLECLDTLNLRDNRILDFENQICPLLQTMNSLRILSLKSNPCQTISKYRDQIVLLSRSIQELDGKDINDQERKYLVNLINKKKVQATVYQDMKTKKDQLKLKVEGQTFEIHQQKKFILNHERYHVSFQEYKEMYGQQAESTGMSEEELFKDYMLFQETKNRMDQENADLAAQQGVPASNIGKSKHLNSGTDFSGAGVHSTMTKHVPYAVRKGGAAM